MAGRRLWRADARRADAVADGAVAGVEGRAGAPARLHDGRLVLRDGHGQQADADRRLLDGVEAFDLLDRSERPGAVDGHRAAHPAAPAQEGDAGRMTGAGRHLMALNLRMIELWQRTPTRPA